MGRSSSVLHKHNAGTAQRTASNPKSNPGVNDTVKTQRGGELTVFLVLEISTQLYSTSRIVAPDNRIPLCGSILYPVEHTLTRFHHEHNYFNPISIRLLHRERPRPHPRLHPHHYHTSSPIRLYPLSLRPKLLSQDLLPKAPTPTPMVQVHIARTLCLPSLCGSLYTHRLRATVEAAQRAWCTE